ncbi:CopG family transcriptional regulator [Deinococcus humi]|uniref:Arc/MetJ-type ribon-helix-helix transcriptional regulator n=1 Tax=Deinococcus humi TaxID=662880 RepID=A0A7W8NIF6_9DEIO|nr:CopG family transcriptional regulator [Deinococcus humi]MBB5365788.1 Arc/MetJ-type ribon-helix-helix transcriptional regulator [Deinococcus humi]GGO39247.1 hypothetical protein GCM10008949_47010 [Deinococcus humi]
MTSSKLSISLNAQLVDFLEHYQAAHQIRSRSEVISEAVALLQERELEQQYAEALEEWAPEADAWEVVTGDGLTEERDAAR